MLQPIDVMKTRLQLDHSGHYKGAPRRAAATSSAGVAGTWTLGAGLLGAPPPPTAATRPARPPARAGMVHCGRTIAKEEGIKSLWKGLTPFVGQLTLK